MTLDYYSGTQEYFDDHVSGGNRANFETMETLHNDHEYPYLGQVAGVRNGAAVVPHGSKYLRAGNAAGNLGGNLQPVESFATFGNQGSVRSLHKQSSQNVNLSSHDGPLASPSLIG